MCLAQGPQRSDAGEARTRGPSVSSQALYHWATALPQRSLNLSNRTFKIDVKILDLLRRFKAGLVKVSALIRGPIRGRAFQWAQQAVRIFDKRKHFQTKWSCFEPNEPILTYSPQIGCNYNHYLAKQSLNWQNFQDGCPIFHWRRLFLSFY